MLLARVIFLALPTWKPQWRSCTMRLYPSTRRRRGLKVQSVLTDNGKEFCGAEGSRPCRLDVGQLGERNRIRDKLGAGIRADDLHLLAHPSAIPIISFLVELWWWTVPQRSEQMRKLDRDGTPSHYAAYRLVSQETLRTDLPALVSVSGGGTTERFPDELVGSRLASENPRELAARIRHALEQLPQLRSAAARLAQTSARTPGPRWWSG